LYFMPLHILLDDEVFLYFIRVEIIEIQI
jgi:hypothetical protein